MVDHPYETAVLVLASMYKRRHADRHRSSFMFNRPGQPLFFGGGVAEVNFDSAKLIQAALHLRRFGASYLRALSIGTIKNLIQDFVVKEYYIIADELFLSTSDCSYGERLSQSRIRAFADALSNSEFFIEPRRTAIFPLVPLIVTEAFDAPPFFLGAPADLIRQVGDVPFAADLIPSSFPPIEDFSGQRETPAAWLGVRAPTIDGALQVRAAVLGAIALLPHHMERYTFSGREMFGGRMIFEQGWSFSFGEPHTPPLMNNLVIGPDDQPWLAELARKLASPTKVDRRHLRALEYFYRAWVPDPVKRFPTLFAAIDAIFGDASQATQAVVDAVGPLMGPAYTSERIRLMLGLRASVIHGGAPNVYESSKYEEYYIKYSADAIRDFELIVARCLQRVIFPGLLNERRHTHADLILRETGRQI